MPVAPRKRPFAPNNTRWRVSLFRPIRKTAFGVVVAASLVTAIASRPVAAQTVAPEAVPTTMPGYIVDANGNPVSTAGVTTTLASVDLPGASSAASTIKKPTKKRTTTRRTKARTATTTTMSSSTAAKSVVALLPTTGPAQSDAKDSTGSGVSVGKPSTTASTGQSGSGVDPTITTLLAPADVPNTVPDEVWAALRKCESNNRYDINTGNGYYGAYQFAAGTWTRLGYKGLPHRAAPAVQDEAAKRLQAKAGWGQWPACTKKLGLR